jgi:hypothetical protein
MIHGRPVTLVKDKDDEIDEGWTTGSLLASVGLASQATTALQALLSAKTTTLTKGKSDPLPSGTRA